MLEHPALPFLIVAALLPVVSRRVGTLLVLGAPVVAFGQLLAIDRGARLNLSYFGNELVPLRLDDLSAPFAYVFVIMSLAAGLYGVRSMRTSERAAAAVYVAAGLAVVLAGDLLTFFVVWEVKAVASAALIAFAGRASVAAAMRYLMFHVAGGTVLLGGILWHLSNGGGLRFERFDSHPATTLMLIGVLVGAAVPPLHAWLSDAYPRASVAGTVFLSAFTTKAAVYALARGFAGTEALVVLGVVMALYGVLYAVLENDIRRLLAYHIISQVGFMVTAVGIGTTEAINGATAHAFAHILYKGLLLMGAGGLVYMLGRNRLSDMGGLARTMPGLLVLYMIGAFSISGVPLFSGFVSKELIIVAASHDGREVVVQLLKLASVGTFLSTGLKLPWLAWGGAQRSPEEVSYRPLPRSMWIAMGATAAANVVIGIYPRVLHRLLPYPVDTELFTASKLSETLQLLLFTALAFALLARKMAATRAVSLDVDWFYRALPVRLAPHARRVLAGAASAHSAAATHVTGYLASSPMRHLRQIDGVRASAPPAVTPVFALGTLMLVAFVVVLGVGLAS